MAQSNPTLHFSLWYFFLREVQTSKRPASTTTKGALFSRQSFANKHGEESLLGTEAKEQHSSPGSMTYQLMTLSQ